MSGPISGKNRSGQQCIGVLFERNKKSLGRCDRISKLNVQRVSTLCGGTELSKSGPSLEQELYGILFIDDQSTFSLHKVWIIMYMLFQ